MKSKYTKKQRVLAILGIILLVGLYLAALIASFFNSPTAVSYTHLDVYKRQAQHRMEMAFDSFLNETVQAECVLSCLLYTSTSVHMIVC